MDLENLVSRSKWQEEDEEGEDVKDNWDDEDEEPAKPTPTAEPKKPTGTRSKKAPTKPGNATEGTDKPLTPQEARNKKLLEEKLQKDSDFTLIKQALGMEDKDIELEFPLNEREDFLRFHKNLVHKMWCYEKSPHYYMLLEGLFRDLCVPLDVDELKNLSSSLNALFNEKVKVNKAKPKKKTIKGLAIKMERTNLDRNDYADELDDIM